MSDENARSIASAALEGDWELVSFLLALAPDSDSIWRLKNTFEQLADVCENEYKERVL